MDSPPSSRRGSTLVVVLFTIAVCSMIIGVYLQTLMPKFRSVRQAASWRDALQAAEAGANHGIHELNELAASSRDTSSYPWAEKGWSLVDSVYNLNGERILDMANLPLLAGSSRTGVSRLAVDVYTREPIAPYHPWFRIRSTGRAILSDRYVTGDRREGRLRQMKLATSAVPHLTRTVEVIVKPRHRFTRGITTVKTLSLGHSAAWLVDSFDSSNAGKSDPGTLAGGVYPKDPAKRGKNGNIASAEVLPSERPYGTLIFGNGAQVLGQVQTAGGDDPKTPDRENVSGSTAMDQSRIRDDFDDDVPPAPSPVWLLPSPAPLGNTNFVSGLAGAPTRYVVSGDLGGFEVLPALPGTTGYTEILVTGNLDIGLGTNAKIVIPPNVHATIYVKGSIDLREGKVNSGNGSSKVASHLTIFGLSTSPYAKFNASRGEQTLSFYGPAYAVTLDGAVTTTGAMVAKTFQVSSGGSGGFHYDERLGRSGDVVGWVLVSYFEDTRGR